MPRKSHRTAHGRGKKGKRRAPVSAHQPAVAPQRAPVFKPPSPPRITPTLKPSTPRHSYVVRELKKIGIIAGAMFLILIILKFVLS